jgi:hypothetical protein
MNKKEILFKKINQCKEHYNNFLGQTPTEAAVFVLTDSIQGQARNFDNMVGYCVQVRLKQGCANSNLVLLRHSNGQLRGHENQSYFKIPIHLIDEIKEFFEVNPEEEDFSLPYKIDNIEAKGFLIRDTESTMKNIERF